MPEELLDLVTTMKCPKCVPTMELVWDTRDLPYTCKGGTTLIPAVTGDFARAARKRSWTVRHA